MTRSAHTEQDCHSHATVSQLCIIVWPD